MGLDQQDPENNLSLVCMMSKLVYILKDRTGRKEIYKSRQKALDALDCYAEGNLVLSTGTAKEYVDPCGWWVAGIYRDRA